MRTASWMVGARGRETTRQGKGIRGKEQQGCRRGKGGAWGGGASGEEGRPERRGLWRGSGHRRKGFETVLVGQPAHQLTSSAWPSSRSKVTTHTHSSQAEKRAQGTAEARAARPEDVDLVPPSPPPAC